MFQPRDRCSGSFWRHVTFGVAIWSHAHDIINGQDLGQSVVFKWDGCIWVVYWIFHIFISVCSKKQTAKFPTRGFFQKVFLFGCSIHFVQIGFSQSPRTEFPETNRLLPSWTRVTSRERMLVCHSCHHFSKTCRRKHRESIRCPCWGQLRGQSHVLSSVRYTPVN